MANDCFLRSLEKESSNESLEYLGQGNIHLIAQNPATFFSFNGGSPLNFESEVDLFEGSASGTYIGRTGTLQPNTQYFFASDGLLKIYPIYDITYLMDNSNTAGQIELDKPYQGNLEVVKGLNCYGHLDEIGYNYKIKAGTDGICYVPFSLDMKGYNLPVVPYSEQVATKLNIIFKNAPGVTGWKNQFIEANMKVDMIDYCDFLKGDIPEYLFNIEGITDKSYISDIGEFKNCPNLSTFNLQTVNYWNGDLVEAFGENIGLTQIILLTSVPRSEIYDLAPLFDAWKTNGKVNSTFQVWGRSSFSVNDNVLSQSKFYTVTFDANGDWTVA